MFLHLQVVETKFDLINQIPLSKLSMERNFRRDVICSQDQGEVEESAVSK